MIDIYRESDIQVLIQSAAEAVATEVSQSGEKGVLLLFSGGSPLEVAKVLPEKIFGPAVTVGVSDERYSTDPAVNNFAQVSDMLWFAAACKKGMQTIDTRPLPNESLVEASVRFDGALKNWKEQYPQGKIIITQGIGLDGHTAGMMPYPENPAFFINTFVKTDRWAVGYDAGEKNKYPLRITTTVPFLLQVDVSVVFVCGEDKKLPIAWVFSEQHDVPEIPGQILHEMRSVAVYTDRTW